MKKLYLLFMLFTPLIVMSQQMNVISFNIRYNNPGDGENMWTNRIEMVSGLLRFHEPDIFGLQEALIEQIEDIQNNLTGYEWFGVGRDDGDKAGEFTPIFFNKSKFILLKQGTFWLSETPEKPSKSWDSSLNRIVTWGHFQSKITGKQFLFFNTHFDHRGVEARKNAAILIREKIEEMTYNKNLPVILTGDFNLTPEKEPIAHLKKLLNDSREISEESPFGPVGTTNQFNIAAPMENRIDYIFVYGGIKVQKYAVLTDYNHQRTPSDHWPVLAKIILR